MFAVFSRWTFHWHVLSPPSPPSRPWLFLASTSARAATSSCATEALPRRRRGEEGSVAAFGKTRCSGVSPEARRIHADLYGPHMNLKVRGQVVSTLRDGRRLFAQQNVQRKATADSCEHVGRVQFQCMYLEHPRISVTPHDSVTPSFEAKA